MLTPEQYGNVLDAEAKLADMDLLEDLAELHDTEACPELRRGFAEQYRQVIGVPPARRRDLRTALERLAVTGRRALPDVMAGYAR